MPGENRNTRNAQALVEQTELWLERAAQDGYVFADLALRWDPAHASYGVDPDVMVVMPAPPGAARLRSVRTWLPGFFAPKVAFELVSHETARKDYDDGPAKYAVAKARELFVHDPEGHGPRDKGGPYPLQAWRRARNGRFTRVYAGDGSFRSAVLGAWVVSVEGWLVVADDEAGKQPWPTRESLRQAAEKRADAARRGAEMERRRTEIERQRAESERQRAESEKQRADSLEGQWRRMVTRAIERGLGRAMRDEERDGLDRRVRAHDAADLVERLDALDAATLSAWLTSA